MSGFSQTKAGGHGARWAFLLAGVLINVPFSAAAAEIVNEDCFSCHDTVHVERFAQSVHGRDLCTSCHSDIQELPHPEKLKKVSCSDCHSLEARIYEESDHGKASHAGLPAAGCLDCHGNPHEVVATRDPASPVYRLNIAKTCATCHSDTEKMAKYTLLEAEPVKSYMDTVHGLAMAQKGSTDAAVCTDCHGSHDLSSPTNPKSKIYRTNIPQTCGKCHENIHKTYQLSVHGHAALAGKLEAPVCTDCHGEHKIRSHLDPKSSVYASVVSEKTCGHCHNSEKLSDKFRMPADRLTTYRSSYHGMADKFGVTTVANCASCHGAHDILPSRDPRSSVHKSNLVHTCGKCHPNVGEQLAQGTVHLTEDFDEKGVLRFVQIFYFWLIFLVIGGMILHNLLDFSKKFSQIYRRKRAEAGPMKFTRNERIQHIILFVSFTVLAYSGFALKFSDAWWAAPLTAFGKGVDFRGLVHRIAAVLFTGLSVYHIWYLLATPRGRGQLKAFWPLKQDLSHFVKMIRYYVGLSSERPTQRGYTYIEKAEYWALAWGSIVMILTGAFMTFENLTMRYFPKWFIDLADTVHFYEAVLATLAIVVWHFYFTIFDPEHYPMHMSMITGKDDGHEKKGETKAKETPPIPEGPPREDAGDKKKI